MHVGSASRIALVPPDEVPIPPCCNCEHDTTDWNSQTNDDSNSIVDMPLHRRRSMCGPLACCDPDIPLAIEMGNDKYMEITKDSDSNQAMPLSDLHLENELKCHGEGEHEVFKIEGSKTVDTDATEATIETIETYSVDLSNVQL